MTSPRVGVLSIQGDVREHLRALAEAGATAVTVGSTVELAAVDGLVIPGGESTTISRLARIDGLLDPLRAARAAGMPMYGSCAGMIMLADRVEDARPDQEFVAGIDMTVRRNAFGRQVDSFEADVDIPAVGGEPVRAVFIRAPWVESVGPAVDVLARVSRGDDDTIVAVRQGPLLATAFHPELTGDARVHELFVEMVRKQA
ncbi:MAG: pyridoxal 5'-phosphate synthase glutaminase subunit PdxT [Candidatus Nanopelagicales bacterium]